MQFIPFTRLHLPKLVKLANKLPLQGYVSASPGNLIYLDVEDAFIHDIFPLLPYRNLSKPDYFSDNNLIGAHISIIYPEENIQVLKTDLAKEHFFQIQGIFTAVHHNKRYFVIGVISESLLAFRHKYGLSDKPIYKNLGVDFHITIAVRY